VLTEESQAPSWAGRGWAMLRCWFEPRHATARIKTGRSTCISAAPCRRVAVVMLFASLLGASAPTVTHLLAALAIRSDLAKARIEPCPLHVANPAAPSHPGRDTCPFCEYPAVVHAPPSILVFRPTVVLAWIRLKARPDLPLLDRGVWLSPRSRGPPAPCRAVRASESRTWRAR
jgi:hypothetical protein